MARLLIIDDDMAFLQAMAEMLGRHLPDAQVDVSGSAAEALYLVTIHHYDMVMCDIEMPHVDGFAMLSRIKHKDPRKPVLLVTGHVDDTLEQAARDGGAAGLIRKPMERDSVLRLLRSLLSTRDIPRDDR